MVNYVFDLAAVDVESAGYGTLTVAGVVPGQYRLLDTWNVGQPGWCVAIQRVAVGSSAPRMRAWRWFGAWF